MLNTTTHVPVITLSQYLAVNSHQMAVAVNRPSVLLLISNVWNENASLLRPRADGADSVSETYSYPVNRVNSRTAHDVQVVFFSFFYRATHVHSAVYAMTWCLSVTSRCSVEMAERTELLPSAYTALSALSYKGIRSISKIRLLTSATPTLSQTLNLADFDTARWPSQLYKALLTCFARHKFITLSAHLVSNVFAVTESVTWFGGGVA